MFDRYIVRMILITEFAVIKEIKRHNMYQHFFGDFLLKSGENKHFEMFNSN